ncbi:hypothetical protein SUGI_0571120 [Cryptomeria japonica]|uniref:nudix hydrolase 3 isoform X2 n=1 Tax=Cryptomeria japonica TaxID=3369 RepID=UPI002408CA02|nr:nudix hydrolase 3 isoform X2 [Cryptomeria japonica]GLJ28948.1 hypothetical protein SUGI_0571120 [Cryptomeria japonica]
MEEYLDVLTPDGQHTGTAKPRSSVHKNGDFHRAVHVWIYAESTGEILLQRRADCKESWPGCWDVSSAGHISAGDTSLISARREMQEELGITLPEEAFELLFEYLEQSVINNGTFINNEFNDVYLVTTLDPIPLEAFTLQDEEVSEVKYISWKEFRELLLKKDAAYVPYDMNGKYGQLFQILDDRYKENTKERLLSIQKMLNRYKPVNLTAELSGLSKGDKEALVLTVEAAKFLDCIFYEQVWCSNPALKKWLEQHSEDSEYDKLKFAYFLVNKGPWSCLDDNKAFLTTADSAVKLSKEAAKPVFGWEGLKFREAFPQAKPQGANFYPPDMDKAEFDLWKSTLDKEQQELAVGFFTVIRRHKDSLLDNTPLHTELSTINLSCNSKTSKAHNLLIVPYSEEYTSYLKDAADLLHKAGDVADTPSLKRLLKAKGDAFLTNDYYDSDIAWMELDSLVDVTIGPYETYEDALYGYKATFEAFIGIRDEGATSQVKLFSNHLQDLENNLPLDDKYKSKHVTAAPIRVIELIYNTGDVKGPQTVAFNLPNDERIVNERGSAMVMLKNIAEAKFKSILLPIADACISKEQKQYVDFDSMFTHTVCHECCHGIGPHTIHLPDGRQSTVRLELQELHSALEEAKADIVGLWALQHLVDQGLLPKSLSESMYVSFLAGCFRSVRFGLEEAHGKGQALQFNWIYEKGGFLMHSNGTLSVDFTKVQEAVETLSREIMTIQAKGDKPSAKLLLDKYATLTQPLQLALSHLEAIQVPVDIYPSFTTLNQLSS